MGDDSVRIDPWSSNQSTDYARIIDQFGLSSLDGLNLPNATKLHRRGIVFAHRDLDVILGAHQRKESFLWLVSCTTKISTMKRNRG